MTAASANAARRVLVLHGFTQNAITFSKRLGALRKQAKDVEMVFLDAPHILQHADIPGDPTAFGGTSPSGPQSQDPALIPRAWWRWNTDSLKAIGLEETLMFLKDTLRKETFDGVMGFSQGAALAALLSALLERPEIHPSFLTDGKSPHPPFKFCIAVAGFKLLDPLAHTIFTSGNGGGYSTPTLHILGKTDIIVTEERSKSLLEISLNNRVEWHDGGHFVPSKSNWRLFVADYLRSGPIPESGVPIPSPTVTAGNESPLNSASSTPSVSGRGTPVIATVIQKDEIEDASKLVASL